MGKQRRSGIKIDFIGQSAYEVTGSAYQIKYNNHCLLLDYGLYQNNLIQEDYKINHEKNKKLKPKEIDYIFISHCNADHFAKLPYLYKNGCTARIFVTDGSTELIKIMLYDSARIMESDSEKLIIKYNMKAKPLYDSNDIEICLDHIQECEFDKEYILDDDLSFKFISARHIVNSSQIRLSLRDGINTKYIGYTGDIGSPNIPKDYVADLCPLDFCDVVIGECTYSNIKRNHSYKDRIKDIEKIKSVIEQTCIISNHKVLIPCFSLDRLQTMLTVLYKIYGNDKNFKTKIIVDTPLGIKVSKLWSEMIKCDKDLWSSVYNWENIIWSNDYETSKVLQSTKESQIILAASGMMVCGRSVLWAKLLLPNENNHILFCGYSGENTTAYKIKQGKKNKYINIDGQTVRNNCNITILNSFSSHMCNKELKEYYSTIKYNKLFLVHSNYDDKLVFAKEMQEILSKNDRTSKVVVVNKDMSVTI